MALWIRDGFEIYTSTNDMFGSPAGYGIWSGSIGTFGNNWGLTNSVTRFNQGQALQSSAFFNSAIYFTNSTSRHTVFAAVAVNTSGTVPSIGWQDGVGGFQLFINFDGNTGNITATNGHGTLGTYTGAFLPGQWNQFQVKAVIDSVNGEVHIRKNGNTIDDFVITGVNTQVTGNPTANGVFLNQAGSSTSARFDDFAAWDNTGSAPWNDFIGDFRISQLQPASDSAVQWTKTHPGGDSTTFGFPTPSTHGLAATANALYAFPFSAQRGGLLGPVSLNLNSAFLGNINVALYDSSGNGALLGDGNLPGSLLATTTALFNPGGGSNTLTWPTPPSVATGHKYFLVVWSDGTPDYSQQTPAVGCYSYVQTYGSFPSVFNAAIATFDNVTLPTTMSSAITFTNAACVGELQADDATTYVSDNVATQVDLYGVTGLPPNNYTVLGADLVIRLEKSDAGIRTVSPLIQSGATLVTISPIAPNTSWNYYRFQQDTDPATGLAWTPSGVNAVLIGQKVAV